jgi:hypothetical protein
MKHAKRDEKTTISKEFSQNVHFYLFIKIKGVELPLKNKIKYPT